VPHDEATYLVSVGGYDHVTGTGYIVAVPQRRHLPADFADACGSNPTIV